MYALYEPVTIVEPEENVELEIMPIPFSNGALAKSAETVAHVGTGWLRPFPDMRDYTEETPEIEAITMKMGMMAEEEALKAIPSSKDLREWCSPIEDQGDLGSCTAHAGVGVVEYFERRAFGKHIDGSRLFVYKATRNLMGVTGDTGAWLRTTMGALTLCGIAPEDYWKYTTAKSGTHTFDDEPPAFVYALADNFEALRYFTHDPKGRAPAAVLASIKRYLAFGIPAMFGFYGFPSFAKSDVKGGIPFPCPTEKAVWGHAIVAVGYDDNKKIRNTQCNEQTVGALLFRNSWGTGWGDKGYGWLPYEYVMKGLALDFWSLLSMEWIDTGIFAL